MKKALFFHTTMNTPGFMKSEFKKRFPNAGMINIVDDSVLPEVSANDNMYTPGIVSRLIKYAKIGEELGASVAVCMCTTITGAVREASMSTKIPFVTIDRPMLEMAVRTGSRVAILVTASTTLAASDISIKQVAKDVGSGALIDTILVPGASDALNRDGDKEKHNRLIAEAAMKASVDHDVIVLAQATMAETAKLLKGCKVPVLSSVESGLEQLGKYLF